MYTGSEGDTKWNKVLGIANILIESWQNEPDVDWFSLYDPKFSIGTVTSTDTFPLDLDEIRKLSQDRGDTVRIVHTDDSYTDYALVNPDDLKRNPEGYYCARIGENLVFNKEFTSDDPQFGGDIQVPKYGYAETLSVAADEVPVDIPNWLVVMAAAEYVRNDITRQNQYPNLVAEANQLMQKMRDDNDNTQVSTVTSSFNPGGQSWA